MTLTDSPVFAIGMMLAGLAAATIWYGLRLKREQMPVRCALLAAVLGSLMALICAKAAYLLHDLGVNLFEGYFDEVTALEAPMLSFVGGSAGFVAGTAIAARICGIRPMKALDLFAAPGCVLICLARIAEGGMDMIGIGGEIGTEWLRFFPLAMKDSWGDAYLAVFVLEALWALVCLIPALRKNTGDREGNTFKRTAVWLLGAQIGFEMLVMYPYIRSLVTSFVNLEQAICAVLLLVIVIRGCVRNRKWWPAAVTAALLGLSTLCQFYRDNKLGFVFEDGWEWSLNYKETISRVLFFLISAALIIVGEKALSSKKERKM